MSYSLSGSYLSSPDTPSAIYPDRRILPLPKRSLRSRLSQEAADSISFPPNLPSTSLPNYGQYGESGDYLNDSKVLVQPNGHIFDHDHEHDHDHDHHHYHDHDDHHHHHDHDHDHEHEHEHDDDHVHEHDHDHDDDCPHHHHHHHHHHCNHDDDEDELDSGEEISPVAVRRTNGYRSTPRSPRTARHARYGSYVNKASPSGPDGYDAFENTNNKKKRKIPTSGSLSLNHSSLSADLASMGLGGSKDGVTDDGSGVGQYYGSGSAALPAGLGVQGAGRGRNSRRSSGRYPLGVSVNGSNARAGAARYDPVVVPGLKDEETKSDQGIISAAIANATALLRKPLGKGQENVGVLDQQANQTPNSQFTFTCESDAKGVTFPEQSLYSAGYQHRAIPMPVPPPSATNQKFAAQGTHNGLNMPAPNNQGGPPSQGAAKNKAQGKAAHRTRPRGDVYALAARQRRLRQEDSNLHHPPPAEDVWICEFCEYESIFGMQPQALIRQYEIKDRKERRRLREKQRLLEKAKLKGRKAKKQHKNAAKTANNASQQPGIHQHAYDPPLDQLADDYLDDGYDDDPITMPSPVPAPPKQSMPGAFSSVPSGSKQAAGGGGGVNKGGTR